MKKQVLHRFLLPVLLLSLLSLFGGSLAAGAQETDYSPQTPVVELVLNGRPTEVEMEDLRNPLMLLQTNRGDMVVELFPAQAPQTVANFVALAEGNKPFIDPATGQQVQRPYYDGLLIHRVIRGFMIQGGSITGRSTGDPGFSIEDEINAVSLGLDRMPLIDETGHPNPVLGIRDQAGFSRKVLEPLYADMGIDSEAALEARLGEVDDRLRSMSLMDYYGLLGYDYSRRFQSRAPVSGVIAMAGGGPDTAGAQFFLTLADAPWLAGKHTVFGRVRAGMEILEAISRVPVDVNNRPLESVTILLVRRIAV